jgi:type I restriction enzyme R subunit
VLVLADRKNLDKQIFGTFYAVGIKVIQAVSVDGLVKLLGNDYGSVFTSTAQKLQENKQPGDAFSSAPVKEDDTLRATRHRRVGSSGTTDVAMS